MFFKKKKKEEVIESKFKLNDTVRFKYHNESFIGNISNIYKLNDTIYYDVLVGGECAFCAYKINENEVNVYKKLY